MDWIIQFAAKFVKPTSFLGQRIMCGVRQAMTVFGAWLVAKKIADGTAVASLTDDVVSLTGIILPILANYLSHKNVKAAVQSERENPTPNPIIPSKEGTQGVGSPTNFHGLMLLALLPFFFLTGCASIQKASYNTIGTVVVSVETARESFVAYENQCLCVTQAQHDKVETVYRQYQAAMKLAQDVEVSVTASGGQNQTALQTAINAVTASAADLIALIEQLLPADKSLTLKNSLPK
ncbi:MAG: hypothetical protein ABSA97_07415 [Verrucomicrobiia bacterium]